MRIQYANAVEKLDRAEKHAKDKRDASQQTIERLQREYEQMARDRRDNDEQVEALRTQADEIERSVRPRTAPTRGAALTASHRWPSTCGRVR